jgi:membrane-associated phospholipid phosphatase
MKPIIFLETFSKIISTLFNPIFSLLYYFIFLFWNQESMTDFRKSFVPILLWVVLPIVVWIAWNVKKGNYSDADVSNQKQRNSLYYFILPLLFGYQIWLYYIQHQTDRAVFFLSVLFLLMMLSNFFIKSSMHTAFNLYTSALFFKINLGMGILWLVVTLVVAGTRIILKRHSISEIFSGTVIALVVSFLYLYSHLFF